MPWLTWRIRNIVSRMRRNANIVCVMIAVELQSINTHKPQIQIGRGSGSERDRRLVFVYWNPQKPQWRRHGFPTPYTPLLPPPEPILLSALDLSVTWKKHFNLQYAVGCGNLPERKATNAHIHIWIVDIVTSSKMWNGVANEAKNTKNMARMSFELQLRKIKNCSVDTHLELCLPAIKNNTVIHR